MSSKSLTKTNSISEALKKNEKKLKLQLAANNKTLDDPLLFSGAGKKLRKSEEEVDTSFVRGGNVAEIVVENTKSALEMLTGPMSDDLAKNRATYTKSKGKKSKKASAGVWDTVDLDSDSSSEDEDMTGTKTGEDDDVEMEEILHLKANPNKKKLGKKKSKPSEFVADPTAYLGQLRNSKEKNTDIIGEQVTQIQKKRDKSRKSSDKPKSSKSDTEKVDLTTAKAILRDLQTDYFYELIYALAVCEFKQSTTQYGTSTDLRSVLKELDFTRKPEAVLSQIPSSQTDKPYYPFLTAYFHTPQYTLDCLDSMGERSERLADLMRLTWHEIFDTVNLKRPGDLDEIKKILKQHQEQHEDKEEIFLLNSQLENFSEDQPLSCYVFGTVPVKCVLNIFRVKNKKKIAVMVSSGVQVPLSYFFNTTHLVEEMYAMIREYRKQNNKPRSTTKISLLEKFVAEFVSEKKEDIFALEEAYRESCAHILALVHQAYKKIRKSSAPEGEEDEEEEE